MAEKNDPGRCDYLVYRGPWDRNSFCRRRAKGDCRIAGHEYCKQHFKMMTKTKGRR